MPETTLVCLGRGGRVGRSAAAGHPAPRTHDGHESRGHGALGQSDSDGLLEDSQPRVQIDRARAQKRGRFLVIFFLSRFLAVWERAE